MTAVTINLEKHPSLGLYVEKAARNMGVTPEVFIVGLINTSYAQHENKGHGLPAKLKNLRGSLAALKTKDLSSDIKAKMILDK